MNETATQQGAPAAAATTASATGVANEAMIQRQLHHIGGAYGVIFALLFFYAWRLTSSTARLARRVEELEREDASRGKR